MERSPPLFTTCLTLLALAAAAGFPTVATAAQKQRKDQLFWQLANAGWESHGTKRKERISLVCLNKKDSRVHGEGAFLQAASKDAVVSTKIML